MNRIVLVAVGVLCLCAVSCRRAPEQKATVSVTQANSTYVHVATILGTPEARDIAKADLAASGIRCELAFMGATYSVRVAPGDKDKAIVALQNGAKAHAYPVTFE